MRTRTRPGQKVDLEIEVQYSFGGENTLAVDPSTHEFFIAHGVEDESIEGIDKASVRPVSVQAALEWYARTETLACESGESVGSWGAPVRLAKAAAALIAGRSRLKKYLDGGFS